MHRLQNHQLYILSGISLSILLIIVAYTIASGRTSTSGRASTASGSVSRGIADLSVENSYVFASPVAADADGSSIIRITAFLLSAQGLGISGAKVQLKLDASVKISQNEPVTDAFGRATFDLISSTRGDYTISAEAEGALLPQKVAISFR